MGSRKLISFDAVAEAYNTIKPLRGKRASEDLRPLWERRYWWRRVAKISDTKYVLLDGDYAWNCSTDKLANTAPITWERKADGDYVTIRNCRQGSYSISRYSFLSWALPSPLWFRLDNGKQFIMDGGAAWGTQPNAEYYLPKFVGTYDSAQGEYVMGEDRCIVFKHVDGKFIRANKLQPMKTKRLDKEATKHYDAKAKELWDWAQIVMPILGGTMDDYSVRNQYAEALCASSYWYWQREISEKLAREILDNDEHDKRMALGVMLCYEVGAFQNNDSIFEAKPETYTNFKKFVRKVANVYATELR